MGTVMGDVQTLEVWTGTLAQLHLLLQMMSCPNQLKRKHESETHGSWTEFAGNKIDATSRISAAKTCLTPEEICFLCFLRQMHVLHIVADHLKCWLTCG